MADSAANELSGGLVIQDLPEPMQQNSGEWLRVEDGQSARDQALPGAPALTATQQQFRDRIVNTSDQYVPEEPPALTAAEQKALEQIPIALKEPVVPAGLTKKWKSRFNNYTNAHRGTSMTFYTFVTHMERAEKAAQKAQEIHREQEEA